MLIDVRLIDGCKFEVNYKDGVAYVHGPGGNVVARIAGLKLAQPGQDDGEMHTIFDVDAKQQVDSSQG